MSIATAKQWSATTSSEPPPLKAGVHRAARHEEAVTEVSEEAMRSRLDHGIASFFFDALMVALGRPGWWATALRLFLQQGWAAKKRAEWLRQGVHVPPFVVFSVTNTCNLKCAGCYAKELHLKKGPDLSSARLTEILLEAESLGVSSVLVAGGEPLTRPDLLDITKKFPNITFPLFTNGTLLDDATAKRLRAQRHVAAVISIEGNRIETDGRRGEGIFAQVEKSMAVARRHGLFFGCSITVTRKNFDLVMSDSWINRFHKAGCRLFVFVEYVPVAQGSDDLVLTQEQRRILIDKAATLRKKFRSLFLAFPGDEDQFGGCLAAGRGFIHISPSGELEACPFAPYSDRNVAETSLKRALGSPLLAKIRENHEKLQETAGGCSLWAEREWVASIAGKA